LASGRVTEVQSFGCLTDARLEIAEIGHLSDDEN
jgi:hypothetical protein